MRSIFYSLLLFIAVAPTTVFGQQIYSPLINLQNPGNTAGGFSDYIGFLYGMAISIAALLAVVKIIIAGAKYMMSDVVPAKGDAISDIQGAILGLLLILGAVIILEFINPQLIKRDIKFDALKATPTVNTQSSVVAGGQTISSIAAELVTRLDPCATVSGGGIGQSGNTGVFSVNASGCSADKVKAELAKAERFCKEKGGTAASGGTGSKVIGCSISLQVAERWKVDEYSDAARGIQLSSKYLTKNGSTVTYEADKFCRENYTSMSIDDCKAAVTDAFIHNDNFGVTANSYCENNAGKAIGSFSCQLPNKKLEYLAARDLYVAIYNRSPSYELTVEEYTQICDEQSPPGQLVDTHRLGATGSADYSCVWY
jgi:hypothetical protein